MTTSFHIILLLLSSLTLIMSETLRYWDLGVHINKNSSTVVQKELTFDQIVDINTSTTNEDQIMAFRANNFVAPISVSYTHLRAHETKATRGWRVSL